MPKGFKILTRKELAKNFYYNEPVFWKETKNFNIPLCGFSSHEVNLQVGNVVGVCIQSNTSVSCPYKLIDESKVLKSCVKLVSRMPQTQDLNIEFISCEEVFFRFRPIYEQFFKITRIVGDSYSVKPVYLEDDLILQKSQNDSFCSEIIVNISCISDREFVVNNCFEKFKLKPTQYDINFFTDNYASSFHIEFILDLLESDEKIDIEKFKENIPFKHYKNIIKSNENLDCALYKFYEGLEKHKDKLKTILSEKEIEFLGSWEKVVSNFNYFYNLAIEKLEGKIEISVRYDLSLNECVVKTKDLNLNIAQLNNITKKSIFRVYLQDTPHFMLPSRQLTDWSYRKISPKILEYLKVGNIVRCILISIHDDSENYAKDYVQLVYQIDPKRFLVYHNDAYSTKDENILFILDVRAICEIPLDWIGNENLESIVSSIHLNSSFLEDCSHAFDFKRVFSRDTPSKTIFFPEPIAINYNGLFDKSKKGIIM